jgi:hypothetical protein
MSFIRERRRQWKPGKQTFKARWRDGEGPVKTSVAAAMASAEDACKAGKYVTVNSNFTSDGYRHRNHSGRVAARCEHKRWLVEVYRD